MSRGRIFFTIGIDFSRELTPKERAYRKLLSLIGNLNAYPLKWESHESDKLWNLYEERRESGLPPKLGAADRQKQHRRQRGCRGHGGHARVQKDAGAAKTATAAPPYAAVTRTQPSLPQTRRTK